ncbi:MAG: hypothetical protein LBB61_10595 [Treponema sp.]|jgi:hypothetical protein|nr:hypothetical protein [Treponema sp.]
MLKLHLAGGVEFDEAKHEYWYRGQRLSGVTGLISKRLGINMPQEFVEEHRMEGAHVHKAVQKWIETGKADSIHPGVKWLIETFAYHTLCDVPCRVYSEVLVSDFKRYASAVDIIAESAKGLVMYDIKKGVFKREYVTWRFSIYKYFIEKYAERKVIACVCISMKDREYYDIFPKSFEQIEKILYE